MKILSSWGSAVTGTLKKGYTETKKVADTAIQTSQKTIETSKEVAKTAVDTASEAIETTKDQLQDTAIAVYDATGHLKNEAEKQFKETGKDITDTSTQTVNEVKEKTNEVVNKTKSTIDNAIDNTKSSVSNNIKGITHGVEMGINQLQEKTKRQVTELWNRKFSAKLVSDKTISGMRVQSQISGQPNAIVILNDGVSAKDISETINKQGAKTLNQWNSMDEEQRQNIHLALDIVGLIPVLGVPADAINGTLYLAEKDYVNAGLSYASAIPISGEGTGVIKVGEDIGKSAKLTGYAKKVLKSYQEVYGKYSKIQTVYEITQTRAVKNTIQKISQEEETSTNNQLIS